MGRNTQQFRITRFIELFQYELKNILLKNNNSKAELGLCTLYSTLINLFLMVFGFIVVFIEIPSVYFILIFVKI